MKITKTEIKNHIEGKDPIATCYRGIVGFGLKIYELDDSEEVVYFVEFTRTKETPKKSKVFVKDNGRSGFRCGNQIVWLDECVRTDW